MASFIARTGLRETRNMEQVMSGIIEKIIRAVRDLSDALTPRPQLVPIPIPVRPNQPRR